MTKAADVFLVFLRLGLTSFGGPIAHLGYFRTEFVGRRRWFDDATYGELVALAQFLPGPSSSQVGMAIGLLRAGFAGMVAAWIGFTLPSALLLVGFAYLSGWVDPGVADGVTHGLMVVAVAVVAQAVVQMSQSLAPDLVRRVMAVAAMAVLLLAPTALMQIAVLTAGGVIGFLVLVPPSGVDHPRIEVPVARGLGGALIALFLLLLVALPLLSTGGGIGIEIADIFYRAGALVFGGGHVVLPILEAELVPSGLIARDTFLAGYGAAQAVPGPLFSFAAYVGAMATHGGILLAVVALIAMFGPSFLLVPGLLPFWFGVSRRRWMRAALMGVNAGVVGLLAAAFVTPIFTSAILSVFDLGLAVAAWAALQWSPAPVWLVVLITGALGLLLV